MPTLEQWSDSITAVLDDLGSLEGVLLAIAGGIGPAALFAAAHPSRTTALVVLEGFADPVSRLIERGEHARVAPAAAERPGLTAVALALATILDDQTHVATQPAAARQLVAILGTLSRRS